MKRKVFWTAFVVIALGAVGTSVAYFRPEWMPPWARLRPVAAKPAEEDAGLFCNEHGVPEKFCTLCHEDLNKSLTICDEHGGIPEAICTLCHPEVEKKYNLKMCKEHGLPEEFCYQCGKGPAGSKHVANDGWCSTHNKPEALCEECLKDPAAHEANANKTCRKPLPLVRLDTPQLAAKIGVEIDKAKSETHAHTLEANAETAFNGNLYAEVTPRVTGFLRQVKVDQGQNVQAGDVLAIVDSAEVAAAKSRHISNAAALTLARVSYERTKALAKRDAVPAKDELTALTALNQAESAALDAAQTLRNLGFTDADLGKIITDKDTSSQLSVLAPIAGMVVERHAVRNEPVQATTQLFVVADTSNMWLWMDIYEADIGLVKIDQPLHFTVLGATPEEAVSIPGRVTWVGAQVDPVTRTTRVRGVLENPQGRLRANQFGQATIQVGQPHEVVVVPKAAVQINEGAEIVFIPEGEGVFRPQRIMTQPSNSEQVVEVTWGVKPGDTVVTQGSFWLKTEVMKGAIGAGCCE